MKHYAATAITDLYMHHQKAPFQASYPVQRSTFLQVHSLVLQRARVSINIFSA